MHGEARDADKTIGPKARDLIQRTTVLKQLCLKLASPKVLLEAER